MPARPALPQGEGPGRLAWLRRLPQGEIQGVLLFLPNPDAGARFQIVDRLMGELAVMLVFPCAEIDVPIRGPVGVALFDQAPDQRQDLLHVFGGLGVDLASRTPRPLASFQNSSIYRCAITS